VTTGWETFVFLGCAIALVGLSCALINDGIDEISTPLLRTERMKTPRAEARSVLTRPTKATA
jgi:hypothetical protein